MVGSEGVTPPRVDARRRRMSVLALSLPLALAAHAVPAQGQPQLPLQVLHWWWSVSESRAVNALASKLETDNIGWQNALIPGGSGVGAGIVLKSRVLAGDAPHVAQLNGKVTLGEWADLGLLHEFDAIAEAGKWESALDPVVLALVRPRGHVIAAPLGIHRINTLFYNRKLLAQLGISPPRNWDEFELAAARLQRAGIPVLAQSAEPWQVSTLFETLVLAEGGAVLYNELFVRKEARAFGDVRLGRALARLRSLKKWMGAPLQERAWSDSVRQLAEGGAAMLVMGDFAKGELNAWGYPTDGVFGCVAAPGTADLFLYDVDTLVMLAGDNGHRRAQEKLVQLIASPAMQTEYNQLKGSIPVLRHPDMAKMDSWSRAAWTLFARGPAVQVPSLTHRMATDDMTRDAMVATVHRFFVNDTLSVAEAQRRLALIAVATTRK